MSSDICLFLTQSFGRKMIFADNDVTTNWSPETKKEDIYTLIYNLRLLILTHD